MSARTLYHVSLTCTGCGATGEAEISEWDHPPPPAGHDRHLRSLPRSFLLAHNEDEGWPVVECRKCRIKVTY